MLGQWVHKFLEGVQTCWESVRGVFQALILIRFNIVLGAICSLALYTGQGQDILRALVEVDPWYHNAIPKLCQFSLIFQNKSQRKGSILCSIAVVLLCSIHQANIGDVDTCPRLARINDFGCNGHEIESLHLLQFKYVGDRNCRHGRRWARRAL